MHRIRQMISLLPQKVVEDTMILQKIQFYTLKGKFMIRTVKLIASTLAFGSRGPCLLMQVGEKKFPFSFLSCDPMITIYLRMNS